MKQKKYCKTRGTVRTENQRNSEYREPLEQWAQRTRKTLGTEDQKNSWYRGPEEQWVERTRRTVGTGDQNSRSRGPEKQ